MQSYANIMQQNSEQFMMKCLFQYVLCGELLEYEKMAIFVPVNF